MKLRREGSLTYVSDLGDYDVVPKDEGVSPYWEALLWDLVTAKHYDVCVEVANIVLKHYTFDDKQREAINLFIEVAVEAEAKQAAFKASGGRPMSGGGSA